MTLYGIEIPPAPRKGDTWAETISIMHLRAYSRSRRCHLERMEVPTKDGYKVRHEWKEEESLNGTE